MSGVWSSHGVHKTEAELLDHARQRSKRRSVFLQRRLVNHSELRGLCGKGLSTVRVLTYNRPDQPSEVLAATFRMPTGDLAVDNFAAGGIAAPVELVGGVLGIAVSKDPRRGPFRNHPDSGHVIAAFTLPMWTAVKDVARGAHDQFGRVPFVGWDVAITDDGPVLLEANTSWCAEVIQIPSRVGLGDTIFPEVFVAHLDVRSGRRKMRPDA